LESSAHRAYVTLLATPDYLPGVAVLAESLRRARARHPLFVVVTEDLDQRVAAQAARHAAGIIRVAPIANPAPGATYRHWNATYSKLQVFGLTRFEKVVFVDADMVVCANIDELFERPHLSAVNAGGLLPGREDWVTLNSGLLVIEPRAEQHREMLGLVGRLPTRDHGDQTFLHAYLPDWPRRGELHLDHGYNLFHADLGRYASLLGYRMPLPHEVQAGPDPAARVIRVVHFVGGLKPWHRGQRLRSAVRSLRPDPDPPGLRAIRLWYACERRAWLRGALRG
jgi:glycogenin glucosyltransferase